ncbi:MAG TPA: hypothetical protein VFB27_04405 [Opitutaceae bacterium]|nr:hypothetical protein [Opitutaceae bacterium]
MKKLLIALFWVIFASVALAGTEVRLWHRYIPPDGEPHFAFSVANYKRGLFWGSCGPSTYSLQWTYDFDLAGIGPTFRPRKIKFRNEMVPGMREQTPVSGEIRIDEEKKRIEIQLKVEDNGSVRDFEGNGDYAISEKS